jgi:asparagine synthase (glutamine-hydrolysing)
MCGITGFINFKSAVGETEVLEKMKRLQMHRGPDDSGGVAASFNGQNIINLDGDAENSLSGTENIWLGFNRLSIQDISYAGHQPMLDQNSKVAFTLNGEIYNAHDFRDDLISKGYQFKSRTDTEVAFKLYLEYGINGMLSRLNGMFAIVILDLRSRSLFLARDRYGIKPLYILKQKSRISFSSEMKGFKALPDFNFSLNTDQLGEFMLFRNTINHTLFNDIKNIDPGTYLEITPDQQIKTTRFHDIDSDGHRSLNEGQVLEVLGTTLQSSVSRQMVSDVKLGSQLSGGVDSSLVTYYASKTLNKGQLETVSITFDNDDFSEKNYIDYITNRLSIKSHQFQLDSQYYFDAIENTTWHFEQPLNHPNTIGIFLLSQEAKKHVTVLLSGEGADEILAGYSRFINQTQSAWEPKRLFYNLYKSKFNPLLLSKAYLNPKTRLILSSSFNSPGEAKQLFGGFNFEQALSQRIALYDSLKNSGVKKHRRYEIMTYLPDLLMRQDKMSMAHSIENRVPFLDNEMVDMAMSVDDALVIANHKGSLQAKKILKDLCTQIFNENFAYRKKMGFSIPLQEFFNSKKYREHWNDLVYPGIKKRGIFNHKRLSDIYSKRNAGASSNLDLIWMMYSFELWAQKYLDQ